MADNPRRGAHPAGGEPSGARRAAPRGATAGALIAEVIGTYLLVFVGTGTIIATQQLAPGVLDATAISLAFGFAVVVAVYVLGAVSGAHINPAVTVALAAVRRFPWSAVPGYVVAQFVGALLASLTTWVLFGGRARSQLLLGATVPGTGGRSRPCSPSSSSRSC